MKKRRWRRRAKLAALCLPFVMASAAMAAEGGAEAVEAVAPAVPGQREDLTTFFLIGIALNVIMGLSFAVWAVRQWRQSGNKRK